MGALKVLELCLSPSLGGLELYMERIGRLLEQKGIAVTSCCLPQSPLANRIPGKKLLLKKRLPYVDVLSAISLLRFVRNGQVDIIHVHQTQDLSFAAFAKTVYPRVRILFTQQMESGRIKKDMYHNWAYSNVDVLLTITDRIKNMLRETINIDPAKIRRLYYGIELPNLGLKEASRQRIRLKHAIGQNEFLVLFPARLDPQKGQELMLEALAMLKKDGLFPRVIFLGSATGDIKEYDAHLQNRAKELGVADTCLFVPFSDDIGQYYAAADISVLASHCETFGLVLIESMAWQTPVIGSRAGGVPEIIDDEADGYLFRPKDAADLARNIGKSMLNREELPAMGKMGRQKVEIKFTMEHHVNGLISVMNETTGERNSHAEAVAKEG